jgi:uncharacterized protein
MPWKNGGGTTTELIIEPPGATLDSGFHWRLSMAEVGLSGPFSRFDGYDRTLLLLDGNGMRLDFEGREPMVMAGPLKPVSFSGDWITSGTLLGGPCRDFNVITQRAHCRHHLEIHREKDRPIRLPKTAVWFAFCVAGWIRVEPFGLDLQAMELLRLEETEASIQLSGGGTTESVLIAIGIDPVD